MADESCETWDDFARILLPLGAHDVFESLAPADRPERSGLDPDFRRPPTKVVVRRHRESVRPDVADREEVSFFRAVHHCVPQEEVARLADGTDDVRGHAVSSGPAV